MNNIPNWEDLAKVKDPHDAEELVQIALKQQMFQFGIPPSSVDRSPLPRTADGGMEISIKIDSAYTIPNTLCLGSSNNLILQIKHTKTFLDKTQTHEEVDKTEVIEFFKRNGGGTFVICYTAKVPYKGKTMYLCC